MQLELIDDAATWDVLAMASPSVTPFHAWSWCKFVERFFADRLVHLLISGHSEQFLCPVFERGGRVMSPIIGYGGPLPLELSGESGTSVSSEVFDSIRKHIGSGPINYVLPPSVCVESSVIARGRVTQCLDLSPGDWAEVWSGMSKGLRSSIHRALREGVVIRQPRTALDVQVAYPVYLESMARVGATYRTPLAALCELAEPGFGNAEMFLGYSREGHVLGGGVFLMFGTSAFHWISFASSEGRSFQVQGAILEHAIKFLLDRGFRSLDLGYSATEGIFRSKSSWGAKVTELSVVVA